MCVFCAVGRLLSEQRRQIHTVCQQQPSRRQQRHQHGLLHLPERIRAQLFAVGVARCNHSGGRRRQYERATDVLVLASMGMCWKQDRLPLERAFKREPVAAELDWGEARLIVATCLSFKRIDYERSNALPTRRLAELQRLACSLTQGTSLVDGVDGAW